MRQVFLAAVASLGLVACVGGINGNNGDDQPKTAKEMFIANVHPILAACQNCHTTGHPAGNVTGFYDPNPDTAYETATHYTAFVGDYDPATAPVLQKILPGNHNNMHYADSDVQAITAWLNKELTDRAGGTTPPPPETVQAAIKRVMTQFVSCMSLTNFQTANMRGDMGNMRSDNPNDACNSCHGNGEYGNIVSNQETNYWNTLSQHSRYLLQYFYVDTSMGTAAAKMVINTNSFMMVATAQPPHQQHPLFTVTNVTQDQTLLDFYKLTMTSVMMAGTANCTGGPTLTD